jgi:C1A family cysteine protease
MDIMTRYFESILCCGFVWVSLFLVFPFTNGQQEECNATDSVAFRGTCTLIDDLNLDDFLQDYEPVYRDRSVSVPANVRRQVLLASARLIANHNESASSYALGFTAFSADTDDDMQDRAGYRYVNYTGTENELPTATDLGDEQTEPLPDKLDWVAEGGVTYVKDQGRCGCCWATSVTGAIEGAAFANNGYLQSMSFQQLISCNDFNAGCDGGDLTIASLYSAFNTFGGLTRYNDYEFSDYKGDTTDECKILEGNKTLSVDISKPRIVVGYNGFMPFAERLLRMKQALVKGPVSMVMKSSCRLLSNYRGGVLTDDGDCDCDSVNCLDHAVLMVGYDDTAEIPYVKIKNSWGDRWGEGGYFRVAQYNQGEYGLFGIMAYGIIVDAQNVTSQIKEKDQDIPLTGFHWFLVAGGAFLLLCVIYLLYVKCIAGKAAEEKEENKIDEEA